MLNVGQTPSSFFERIKKQSKKLFSLSKLPEFKINNLSEAQEIVAKMNGYPTWYDFNQKISFSIESEKDNQIPQIAFKKAGKSQIKLFFDGESSFNATVCGMPGTGKTTIAQSVIFSNVVKREVPIKTAVVDTSNSYRNLTEIINSHKKDIAINVNIAKDFINILDVPLGFTSYSLDNMHLVIYGIIEMTNRMDINYDLNTIENNVIYGFLAKILFESNFIKWSSKYYSAKKYPEIDSFISKLDLNMFDKKWMDLVSCFLLVKQDELAKIAMREASPTLGDLVAYSNTLIKLSKMFLKNGGDVPLSSIFSQEDILIIKKFINNLESLIKEYPEFNQPTKIQDNKNVAFISFNVDRYTSSNNKFLANFVLLNIHNYLDKNFYRNDSAFFYEEIRKLNENRNLPGSAEINKNGWEYYCNEVNKEDLLYCYAVDKNRHTGITQLILDEDIQSFNEILTILLRESRKKHLSILVVSKFFNDDVLNFSCFFMIHTSMLLGNSNSYLINELKNTSKSNESGWRLNIYNNQFTDVNKEYVYQPCIEFKS